MFLAKVIGTVWATRKDENMHGFKMQFIQPIDSHTKNIGSPIVAVDTVGAGDGFAAMMCIGILNGWTITQINKTASEFSARLCEIEGALPIRDSFYTSYRTLLNNG